MYDADVVFLLLSSPCSARFVDFLALHNAVANAGFHTVIATSPAQVSHTAGRLRVLVIDGDPGGDFDPYAVTEALRQVDDAAIMLLTEAMPLASERGLHAGADICLPRSACTDDILDALGGLASASSPMRRSPPHGG
ncbi:hypothetical protein [Pusillimonas sp.]|uniref:hypothetical protein n=1 Tax=Pusillimonas sp. TaxID=3040095 RepID=UPI0029A584A7|nr:hypothetical protein [Pusillimonas sp.]MDX3893445.1 hypothetical protein [Pusillimonas sp.]